MPARKLRLLYAGIEVRDPERSLRFYQGLGFKVHNRGTMEHGGIWIHLRLPGQIPRIELNWYPPKSRFGHAYRSGSELDHFGFRADDPEAWGQKVVELGGKIVARVNEPHEWLIYATDPDGIWLEFIGDPADRPKSANRNTG